MSLTATHREPQRSTESRREQPYNLTAFPARFYFSFSIANTTVKENRFLPVRREALKLLCGPLRFSVALCGLKNLIST